MGIFGRSAKKDENYDDGHNHNLFSDDDDFVLPAHSGGIASWNKSRPASPAPHALTPDEVLSSGIDEIHMERSPVPAPTSVYKRMKEQELKNRETAMEDDYVPSWAGTGKREPAPSPAAAAGMRPQTEKPAAVNRIPENGGEVKDSPTVRGAKAAADRAPSSAFLERCKIALNATAGENPDGGRVNEAAGVGEPTVHDDPLEHIKNHDINFSVRPDEPSDSVSDSAADKILMTPSHGAEDGPEYRADDPAAIGETEDAPKNSDTIEEDTRRKVDVEVEIIPVDSPSDIMHTINVNPPHDDVRIYGKVIKGSVIQHTPDGDIDVSEAIRAKNAARAEEEKTVLFNSIERAIIKKADDSMNSPDRSYDYGDDDDDIEDMPYYETNDESLDGVDDYKSLSDAARLRVNLTGEKSRGRVISLFSAIAAVLIIAVSSPLGALFGDKSVAIINLVLFSAALIVNYGIFADLKNLFRGKPGFDSCVAVASVMALVQSSVCSFVYGGGYAESAAAAACLLAVNSVVKTLKTGRILTGLERIATSEDKRAAILAGKNESNTIASGAVEGEALVLCGKSTVNITDYMKNSYYASPFDLKVRALFFTGIAAALISGLAAGYLSGLRLGLTLASLMLCCIYPACAVLTCELPMYFAAKRAARYGAMLAGYKGAYHMNRSNTVAVSTSDLFPAGTVKLYNMKPLGNNEIGESLVDSAAVAIAADSPLADIFKSIIGSAAEKNLPKVDRVQYEDRMGLCGYIGEKTILIGNRDLMQGHNIEVPPLTVDRKVLRAGYFPVYIACSGIPCLLFVVKYEADPNIALELQRLYNTGMTVVVNPEDPNATDLMLCNYFGLPNDAVKVMDHNGRTVYERNVKHAESVSAHCGFGRSVCGFFSAITSSIKLGGIYSALAALFIISAVLGAAALVYMSATGKLGTVSQLAFPAYQLLFVLISAITAKVKSR